jgi:ABC-2 type transport system ATP-binding protein
MITGPSQPAIAATRLRKSYGEKIVLDCIDLNVAAGTIFALLGPNGAGKTTAVKILSTLIGADGGEVRVAGHDLARDPDSIRAAIGVTGQYSTVDGLLTGEQNLILMADLHHLGRAEGRRHAAELLRQFDLVETAKKTAATYSGGMRRRLDLAMPWSAIRASSSSTNRPPASTRAAAAPCGRSSATSWPAESPSS